MAEIVNKIKQSKLETVDLEKFANGITVFELDLKDFLYQELILKENDYRDKMDDHDWSRYTDGHLAVYCSTDAIIPKWAYMLVVQHAYEFAEDVHFGNQERVLSELLIEKIEKENWEKYDGRFVLLKGCSKMDVSADVYMAATKKLLPYVKKLMYGEACSNVPVYRQKRSDKKQ